MNCPLDHSPLENRLYEAGMHVDGCPGCGGMWLERGELERIQDIVENDYAEELARMPDLGYRAVEMARQKSGRRLECPRCGREMETREYARCSQVLIDVCPGCGGIWLDKGEIEALEIFYERARAEAQAQAQEVRKSFLASLLEMRL